MWFLYIIIGFIFGFIGGAACQVREERKYVETGFAKILGEWYKITKLSDLKGERDARASE